MTTISRVALAVVAAAGVAAAQDSITMVVDGVGTCSVQNWAFGATNSASASAAAGGGAGAGRVQISALVVTRTLDKCSTALFALAADGKHVSAATLTQKDANGNTIMVIKLEMVFIGSYQVSGTASNPIPAESVALAFEKIGYQYSGPGGPTQTGWDLTKNAAISIP